MKKTLRACFLPLAVALAALFSPVSSQAQSYSIDWYKVSGGGGTSSNGQYSVSGTIGQQDASAAMTGGNYALTGGFWSIISVVQMANAPILTIVHSGGNVTVSWPSSAVGFVLQQNANLAATNSWATTGYAITTNGPTESITITPPTGNLFFRLFQ